MLIYPQKRKKGLISQKTLCSSSCQQNLGTDVLAFSVNHLPIFSYNKTAWGSRLFFTFTFPHCVTHCSRSRIKTKYAPPALAVPEAPVDPAGRKKLQWYEGTHFDTHREILNFTRKHDRIIFPCWEVMICGNTYHSSWGTCWSWQTCAPLCTRRTLQRWEINSQGYLLYITTVHIVILFGPGEI